MAYLEEIAKEYKRLQDKRSHNRYGYVYRTSLVKKSKSRHFAKLRRYIARTRGEHVPNQKWLAKLFEGRQTCTPWKCKGLPYITKAKRIEREERFAKVLGFLNGK